jgi:hypothetical protein
MPFAAVHESFLAQPGHAAVVALVRCWGQSGKLLLAVSISAFDPQRSLQRATALGVRYLIEVPRPLAI